MVTAQKVNGSNYIFEIPPRCLHSIGGFQETEKQPTNITMSMLQYSLYGRKFTSWSEAADETIKGKGLQYDCFHHKTNHKDDSVKDSTLSTRIPCQLRISSSSIPGQNLGIFTTTWLKEGTRMGPFTGRYVSLNEDSLQCIRESNHVWEIFDVNGCVDHFIDGKDELGRNWLCFIQCARNDQEQNLEIVQHEDKLYYYALRDIPTNEELLVWYGNSVEMFLGIPQNGSPGTAIKQCPQQCSEESYTSQQVSRLKCTICRRGFNTRSNLRSHMRIHTLEKPFRCKFCNKSFSQSSTLKNHVRLHTGERPYNCTVCKMAYSQLAGLRAHQKSSRHRPTFNTTLY